ncbi:MAG: leucine-rich repeat protein [Clostridia bacterium]|nr:leucine-rich repeat protein [Clostridia bacterium]
MKKILSLTLAILMILACTPIVMAESEFEYVDYEDGIAITGYNGEGGVVTIPAEIDGKKVLATKSTMSSAVVNALGGRNDITKIIVSEGIKLIGYDSFYGMTNLKEVVLPSTLERIADGAFAKSGITSISIPEGVTMINGDAFCQTKLTSIHIPKNAMVGGSIVSDCNFLKKITVDPANPYYAADGKYLYSKNNGTAVDYAGGLTDKRIVIPIYIKNIMHYCFINNENIETVIAHKNVVKFYSMTFIGCTNLKEVYITGKNTLVSKDVTDNPNLIVYTNGKICDFAAGEKDTCDDFIVKPYIEGMENPNTPTTTEKAKETTTKPSTTKPEKTTIADGTTESTTETTTFVEQTTESTTLKETEANTVVNSENTETTGNDKNNATPIIIGVVVVAVAGAVAIGVAVTMKKKKK